MWREKSNEIDEMQKKKKKVKEQANGQVSFHLLDIPPELAFIYSKVDSWNQVHTEQNILKLVEKEEKELLCKETSSSSSSTPLLALPSDINSFSFNKFIQIYIKVSCVFLLNCPLFF
jgi:myosin XV